MREIQLLVIGDSHADFWNGTGDHGAPAAIRGVRTHALLGATAYSLLNDASFTQARSITLELVRGAVAEGYSGWVMLYFGANDCNAWIWRQVPRLTLADAVSAVVERYVQFILELQAIYPKIAVFGPPTATKNREVGTETERNLAILLFTTILQARLKQLRIPCMSMARAMIGPDGTTPLSFFRKDLIHITSIMLPYALHAVNAALGLDLQLESDPLGMKDSRVVDFEYTDTCELFERRWLRYALLDGAQYISEFGVWPQTFEELGTIEVATTLNGLHYSVFSLAYTDNGEGASQKRYLPFAKHAREVLFSSHVREIEDGEIEIYRHGSHLGAHRPYSREVLFSIHDEIMRRVRIPAVCGELGALSAQLEIVV